MPTNDNDFALNGADPASHAHGQAALLLVESLIHGLCEKGALSVGEAVAIAERAADVQRDHDAVADSADARTWRSHALLSQIAESLRADDREGPPPRLVP